MNNQQTQMDLLPEERTPSKTLQYALAREKRQESQQKKINTNTNPNTSNPWFEKIQYIKHTTDRKITNQIAGKRRTLDDVTNQSNPSETKHSAFRHLHDIKQLPSLTFNNSNNTQLNQNYINSNSIITNHLYKSPNPSITNHLFESLSSRTSPLVNTLFSRKIHITTKNNPDLNTYTVPIKKRHRGPNKKTKSMTIPKK